MGAALRAAAADVRDGAARPARLAGLALAPSWSSAGHAGDLRSSRPGPPGRSAPPSQLLPLALLVLLAMAVPLNIGGWGPREGVAAWAFGAAGLGAAQGVATAVAYGVLALVGQPARGCGAAGGRLAALPRESPAVRRTRRRGLPWLSGPTPC